MKNIFLVSLFAVFSVAANAGEWSGYLAVEGRAFFQDPLDPRQTDSNLSISAEPEYYQAWQDGVHSLIFKPFLRLDQQDDQRTHVDIRELQWTYAGNGFETRIGIAKEYWGVTEALHLVDIINQTDLVENPDGEQKLGQPMAKVSVEREWGTLDVFLLPWFRERTYPGVEGRMRVHPRVDSDHPLYESSAEQKHVDAAIRWSHYFGDWDIGLAYFRGTGRDPLLQPAMVNNELVLRPYYEKIAQVSTDIQATLGAWLWKFEGLYRQADSADYYAFTGGFEYTLNGFRGSDSDLGLLAEVMFDERDDNATTPFNHDLFFAFRWAANDEQSTELLAGVIYDWQSKAKLINLEASRRLGQNYKLSIQYRGWVDVPKNDLLSPLNQDDYLQVELAWYF